MKYLLLGLALSASVVKAATTTPLPGTQWELLSIRNAGHSSLAPKGTARPTLAFQTDNTLSGFAGCNQYRGQFQARNKRLAVKNIVSTKMACGNLEFETRFFGVLNSAERFVGTPKTLTILNAKGDALLFTRAP